MPALRLAVPIILGLSGLTGACAQPAENGAAAVGEARASLINRDREVIGHARFQQAPTGVLITVEIDGAPAGNPGWHGTHLHAIGDCSNEDFTSSGGHINPFGRNHGLLNPGGPDNGDLPNIYVHADGVSRSQMFTTLVSIGDGSDVPALLDQDGSAIVFHANPDDHMSQPIGGAGPRILCGVIEAVEGIEP